jgi:hypothetical protein
MCQGADALWVHHRPRGTCRPVLWKQRPTCCCLTPSVQWLHAAALHVWVGAAGRIGKAFCVVLQMPWLQARCLLAGLLQLLRWGVDMV